MRLMFRIFSITLKMFLPLLAGLEFHNLHKMISGIRKTSIFQEPALHSNYGQLMAQLHLLDSPDESALWRRDGRLFKKEGCSDLI